LDNKEKSEEEPEVDFKKIEEFVKKGEDALKEKEEKVEEKLGKEEEKLESLEEKKDSIEQKKKEIEEKIEKEKEKVEQLKEEEQNLQAAEEKAEELRDEVEKKGFEIKGSIKKIAGIFKKEKSGESAGGKRNSLQSIYEDHYKKLLIIPFLLLLLAIVQISYQYGTTGDFVNRGVELKGGLTLTISNKTFDTSLLEEMLREDLGGDVSVRKISQTKGLLIEASDIEQEALVAKVGEIIGKLNPEDYSVEQMGSSLGASFFREITRAILIAFILMGVVVFITFRVPAPSLAVILAALSDIVVTLAIFNLTGAKLGKGGIAAFLMLIGYSVDTDILLSTKVLKRKFGTVMKRIYSAMKTGLTMNITTITAIIVALIFTQSEIIRQIMTILLIGLFVDMVNTWIQNVGILRLYMEKKGSRK